MQKHSISQSSKPSNHFLLNILIISMIVISNFGKMVSPVNAQGLEQEKVIHSNINEQQVSQKSNEASTKARIAKQEPAESFSEASATNEQMPAQQEFGAQLICLEDYCSEKKPGIHLVETVEGTAYLSPWGSFIPSTFSFRIDCDTAEYGCTQHDIYYHATFVIEWGSPFNRGYVNASFPAFSGSLPGTGFPGYSATGSLGQVPCGYNRGGTCTYETWGVLNANRIYPYELPSTNSHFIIQGNVHGLGTFDTIYKKISVEVSFDPEFLTAKLPEDAMRCTGCSNISTSNNANNYIGDPINTRTGVFSYKTSDIGFLSKAGDLSFQRIYISNNANVNETALGYGWTHNHDIRLIFSQPGFILFKDENANIFRFWDKGNDTFQPYNGVTATLRKNTSPFITYALETPSKTIYVFSSNGRVLSKTDEQGNLWEYVYDEVTAKLLRVNANNGARFLAFAYNDEGLLSLVSDHTERGVSFYYDDGTSTLTTAIDILGQSWQYEYDTDHRLLRVLDAQSQQVVRNTYYPSTDPFAGRIYQQYDGNDNLVVALTYNPDGSTTIQDGLGNTRTDVYNKAGVLVETSNPDLLSTTSKTYDHNFRPETVTDALGNQTELDWSDDGADLTSFTDAAENETTITYIDHKPQTITGPNGVATTYVYTDNLLTSVTTAGQTTNYTYYTTTPRQGLLETVQDPSGMVTKYEYDVHGQQTRVIANYDPNHGENEAGLYNLTTKYEYDELGRVTKISTSSGKADPAWLVSYNEYDDAGKLVLSVRNYNPDFSQNHQDLYNLTTRYTYDVRGRQIAVQDTYGSITRTYYNNANRIVAVVRNLALAGRTVEAAIADENIPARGSAGPGMNLRSDYYYDAAGNQIATQDERGIISRTYNDRVNRTVTSVQNLQGQDVYTTSLPTYDPLKPDENVISRSVSDANGNMIAIIDNSGVITRTYYDELNRPKRVVQNLVGQGIEVAWLADSACGSVDENLCTDTFYDVSGNLIATKDPQGIVTRTYYDQLNRPIRVVQNLQGQSIETNWLADSLCNQSDANGNVSINLCSDTVYDDSGRMIASQDSRGQITRTYYDAAGRVATVVRNLTGQDVEIDTPPARAAGAADENIRTDTEYDGAGRRSLTTDPLGNQVQYEYDLLGRLSKTTVNPWPEQPQNYQGPVSGEYYNLVTTYTYDALGRTLTTTDTADNISLSEYDPQSGLLLSTSRNDLQTVYHYDLFGRQIAVTDPQGSITRSYFDGLGRTVDTVRNLSNWEISNPIPPTGQTSSEVNLRSSVVYGSNGQVQESIATDGTVTEYEYDALGRQTRSGTPPLPGIRSVYDSLGRLVMSIAPSSDPNLEEVVTRYAYDAQGRLTDVWENYRPGYTADAETNVHTQYTYDAGGNRLTIRDGNGHATAFTYDKLGRLWTEADALGHTWTYSYNKNSNRTALLDANGATTQYEYSSQGRLVGIDYPSPDADVAFEYDFLGRRTEMQDGLGTTTWADYNDLNQPTAITDPFGDTVTYAYDDFGNRSGLTYPDSGMVVSYDFDQAQRPNLVSRDQSPAAEYVYDMLGRVQNINLANGVVSQYNYSETGQLESILHLAGEQELASYQYEYYDNGNRKQAVELVSGSGAATGPTVQVTVVDTSGIPLAGKTVYAFNGSTYTNYSRVTDAEGRASITLPAGSYRFRVDVDGTQFWSGEENHCEIGQCGSVEFSIPQPVLVSVTDSTGAPQAGLKVYAFDGTTYTNFSATTDANGQVSLRLPLGNYRFRADFNGTQFWSGPENHCPVPGCTMAEVRVTRPMTVSVKDHLSTPQAGIKVYAFDGAAYTNHSATTGEDGTATLTLPAGSYRFRADLNGTQFWSAAENHCEVVSDSASQGQGCESAKVTLSNALVVTVADTAGAPKPGVKVYAFNSSTYTNYSATTDENGQASFTLPEGSYRFRADYNGTQFWSGIANHCAVPGCDGATVTVTSSTLVTVVDSDGAPKSGLKVYAFNGSTYTNYSGTTNASGQVSFTLPQGSYRFRADLNGTQFWSAAANHCDVPGCDNASVVVSKPLTVTVKDTEGTPKSGLKVYAFNGATYTNYSATTNANGQVTLTLPFGSYRFRADLNGTQFWSASANHCSVVSASSTQGPGCESAEVTVSIPLVVSIRDGGGTALSGVKVYAFNGSSYTNYSASSDANGNATLTLPLGNYRFRADYNGLQYWSDTQNHCAIPGCASLNMIVGPQIPSATPSPTSAPTSTPEPTQTPQASPTVEAAPQETLTLTPEAWLPGAAKVFALARPGGEPKAVERLRPQQNQAGNQVVVTVLNTDEMPQPGLKVYAFDGAAYTNYSATTDSNGQAVFTLPQGEYRFRADFNGTQFWSGPENHCSTPGCASVSITVSVPVVVTVLNTDEMPKPGLKVYAFDGTAYTNYSATTDSNGQAVFTLPQGDYRFRADLNGTQFWSGPENHCSLPACTSAAITVSKPVTVTVAGQSGQPYPNLPAYAFDGTRYTGHSATTDASGKATFTLPLGEYRFRADYDGVQFWSSPSTGSGQAPQNHCTIPGCEAASVTLPGGTSEMSVMIDYEYDPLNRLTKATYSDPNNPGAGDRVFEYTYDAVGNRLSQTVTINGLSATTTYLYDDANRLTSVGGVAYTYDNNGNLLSDGANTYSYDAANRLISVTSSQGTVTSYGYNGLGDRLTETVNGVTTTFTMDLSPSTGLRAGSGLTQALSDGTHDYLYGHGRIAQSPITQSPNHQMEYFLGDALGSVRQLTDQTGAVTFAQTYDPYGVVTTSTGSSASGYGFTGEYQQDGLVYLRARHYAPGMGRFLTRDTWPGEVNRPLSLNRWGYVEGNSVNFVDPTGHCIGCFLFYFSGAGYNGTNIDDSEVTLLNEIEARTQAKVIKVYPYGLGTSGTANPFLSMLLASNPNAFLGKKSEEILAYLLGHDNDLMCHDYSSVKLNNWQYQVTFLAYSGGGQMAYTTAENLKEYVLIDDLITLGAPFKNYGGENIHQMWLFEGEDDEITHGLGLILSWQSRSHRKNVTHCDLLGDNNDPYGHWYPKNYFDDDVKFMGANCRGSYASALTISREQASLLNKSRLQANVDMIVGIMEGWIGWAR